MQRLGIATWVYLVTLVVYLATGGTVVGQTPVPLFTSDTKLEPETVNDTPMALITRVGDRVRDRHAREWMFHAYDHYLPLYWEHRTVSIEIVDRVAKGGDSITYNFTSLWPLNKPNLRAFFRGVGIPRSSQSLLSVTNLPPRVNQEVIYQARR